MRKKTKFNMEWFNGDLDKVKAAVEQDTELGMPLAVGPWIRKVCLHVAKYGFYKVTGYQKRENSHRAHTTNKNLSDMRESNQEAGG